jgi:hypothetical protein
MGAEIALGCRVVVGIDIQSIVRTSLHAALATDAAPVVEINDAIGPPVESARRTNFRARGVIAVIASHHAEVSGSMREFALFNMLDPRPENAHRYLVLFFARDRAGMASDTTVLIYDKTVSHLWKVTLAWRSIQSLQDSTS